MNFASWNVRGLNKTSHKKEVMNFISANKLNFVGLLETKVQQHNSVKVSNKLAKNWRWLFNYDYHHYGRVWVGWNSDFWDVTLCNASAQHITCLALFKEKQIRFMVTFVYAHNEATLRTSLWNYLSSANVTLPWCVTGDFNCVLSMDEIRGGRHHWTPEMQSFKDCVVDAQLDHIKSVGEHLTWYNNRPSSPVHKKLDRMLGNSSWHTTFSEALVQVGNRGIMDHCSLILTVPMTIERYSKPFQFFNFMINLDGFLDTVKTAWDAPLHGDHMSILCRKLKLVKSALIDLNKKNGNLHSNVAQARATLNEIQTDLTLDPNDLEHLEKEKQASIALNKALDEEESLSQQKSRVRWLQLGDNNSSFFFNQTRANWNHNKILAIQNSDGVLVHGHCAVAATAVDYFQNSLGRPCHRDQPLDLSGVNCKALTETQASHLEDPFTAEQVYDTLKHLKKNKAPGPDGFNVEFFLASWDIVGDCFTKAILSFFENSWLHNGVNHSSIALIPKTASPLTMKDFRPISLCTVAYKCISKLMAERMKLVLPHVIDPAQSAFVPGRSISDNVIMAQELFRGYSRETGMPKCALKVDLHKAFDSVLWDFILASLEKLNFPQKFCSWVKACVCFPKFSVKINGTLNGYFSGAKGLRQGCPMSPYLFTVAMNVLSCILNNPPADFSFHWKCKESNLTHLFFADDVLLFSKGDKASITHILDSLALFSKLSGLNPSMHKSTSYLINCDDDVVDWFDASYGVPRGELPVPFLGVPLISAELSINHCMPLIQKIVQRIESWTALLLSFAGRVQLIKAVLFAIQAYWTRHFMLPAAVHKKLQQIFTRFLWRGDHSKIGGAKISWVNVCKPRNEGGLGIKNLVEWNNTQLLMHFWKLIKKHESLWVSWIYGTTLRRKNFWTMKIPTDCSWFWRNILKLRDQAKDFISYRIGNGKSISFWLEPWWRGNCIASSPTDSIIANSGSNAAATVGDHISSGGWSLPQASIHRTRGAQIHSNWLDSFDFPVFDLSKDDVILWNGMPKLTSHDLWDSIRENAPIVPWCDAVWLKHGTSRYAHHNWLLSHGRLYTLARLHHSFGMDLSVQCFLCINGEETDSHLFLHCPYSRFILDQLLDPMGINANFNQPWHSFITDLSLLQDSLKGKVALLAMQIYAYHIWRERNARLHNKGIFGPGKLLHGIKLDLHSRLATVKWFSEELCNRPELYFWIA